jgi:hypothetical protein
MLPRRLLVFPFLLACTACATTSFPVPEAWLSVPQTHAAQPAPRRTADGPIRIADEFTGPKLANGGQLLTEPFAAIDSFDYSESRGEVVFSARRDSGYDIGLVSSDGSPISWVPADPADEVAVQWAPRGNKISYVLRLPAGDIIRTLHIPTAASMAVPFDGAAVHGVTWDAAAERFTVSSSTLDASPRVEVMKYSGAERKVVEPPAVTLDVELEPVAPGAVLLRPRDLKYDEKLPLVIWSASDLSWSDARAALLKNARVALVVATREPGDALWKAVNAVPWIDASRAFSVGTCGAEGVCIVTDPKIADGTYVRRGRTVAVAPAVVQSFAAGFIADQLKRTGPTNGSSR